MHDVTLTSEEITSLNMAALDALNVAEQQLQLAKEKTKQTA